MRKPENARSSVGAEYCSTRNSPLGFERAEAILAVVAIASLGAAAICKMKVPFGGTNVRSIDAFGTSVGEIVGEIVGTMVPI